MVVCSSAASTLRTGRPRSCRSADVDYAHRWSADLWSALGATEEVAGAADRCRTAATLCIAGLW